MAGACVYVYATHATQAVAFEWKPGFRLTTLCTMSCTLLSPATDHTVRKAPDSSNRNPQSCIWNHCLKAASCDVVGHYVDCNEYRARRLLIRCQIVVDISERKPVVGFEVWQQTLTFITNVPRCPFSFIIEYLYFIKWKWYSNSTDVFAAIVCANGINTERKNLTTCIKNIFRYSLQVTSADKG